MFAPRRMAVVGTCVAMIEDLQSAILDAGIAAPAIAVISMPGSGRTSMGWLRP